MHCHTSLAILTFDPKFFEGPSYFRQLFFFSKVDIDGLGFTVFADCLALWQDSGTVHASCFDFNKLAQESIGSQFGNVSILRMISIKKSIKIFNNSWSLEKSFKRRFQLTVDVIVEIYGQVFI